MHEAICKMPNVGKQGWRVLSAKLQGAAVSRPPSIMVGGLEAAVPWASRKIAVK
jgi:hypothetical protein